VSISKNDHSLMATLRLDSARNGREAKNLRSLDVDQMRRMQGVWSGSNTIFSTAETLEYEEDLKDCQGIHYYHRLSRSSRTE